MFEKGQICTVEIMDMSDQGQGIGRADGMAVFVPDTVVGDLARVQLTKVKKSYAFAKLLEIEEPSTGWNLCAREDLRKDAEAALWPGWIIRGNWR